MMRLLRQIRDLFLYCGISKEDYRSVKKDAYMANFRVWRIVHVVMIFVSFAMMCTHLTGWPSHIGSPLFIARMALFFYSVIMSILFFHVLKPDGIAAQLLCYLTMILLFVFALFLGLHNPAMMSTLFIILLVLLPMFMIDKPYYMATLIVLASLIHITHCLAVKEPEALRGDLIYTAVFGLLGVITNTFYNMLRVREFMLKRQEVIHLNDEKRAYKKAYDLYTVITAITSEYDILAGIDYAAGVAEYFRALPWTDITVPESPDGRGEAPFSIEEMHRFCVDHVDPEYQEIFLRGVQPARVREGIRDGAVYAFRFRIRQDGKRPWYELRAQGDGTGRVLVGIRSIDAEIREETARQKEKRRIELAGQMAIIGELSADYVSIVYVTITPSRTADKMHHHRTDERLLNAVPGWRKEKNFHNSLELIMRYLVADEDRDAFFDATRREVILANIEQTGTYHFNFRARLEDTTAYYQIKFAADRDADGHIRGLVVGMRSMDREMRERIIHEQELTAINERAERTIARRTAELNEKNRELQQTGDEVLELLGDVVELRDAGSGKHVRRVKNYSRILAAQVMRDLPEYGLTEDDVLLIANASVLHDLGKIRVSDTILLKPGALTVEEHRIMQSHCEMGRDILLSAPRNWDARFLHTCSDICLCHHERWDGTGYPAGLKGDDIPISAQIVSIADCFDALTTARPYKDAFPCDTAMQMIENGECGAFNAKLLACFRACAALFRETAATEGTPDVKAAFAEHPYIGGTRLSGMHILVADANELSLSLTANILRGESASAVMVRSGVDALEVFISQGPFDALLTGLSLPDMDGFELAERLRSMERHSPVHTPLIVLTDNNTAETAGRASRSGVDACMTRPLDIGELTKLLNDSSRRQTESIGSVLAGTIVTSPVDSLTHVKSITAYTDIVANLSEEIHSGGKPAFAVVMCDVNDLRSVNATYGHDVGDIFIRNCCRIVCRVFAESPVYRIGGDEFAVLLRDKDYLDRDALMRELESAVSEASKETDFERGRASFAAGISVFSPDEDSSVTDVVRRAERAMRRNKNLMRPAEQA